MALSLLNGEFEASWSDEDSHQCLRVTRLAAPEALEREEVFTPPGWLVWFRDEEGWSPPEGRYTREVSPARFRSGEQGYMLTVEGGPFDAGLMQQVAVTAGERLRFTIWAHAWSNQNDAERPERYPHPNEPGWSEGAGFEPFMSPEGRLSDHPSDELLGNATFWVGIDPTGGRNPVAESVVWGQGAHIYNEFAAVPAVDATAEGDRVTVFTRVRFQGNYRHQEAYWDDARLVAADERPEEPAGRGTPRIQYERYYVLLPPGANKEWAQAVVDATWDRQRYTVGGSADDAGIGDLDSRIVLAVNPEQWGGPDVLKRFFAENYPGVRFRSVRSGTPAELLALLHEY
jgi:hypothetical protein